MRPLAAPEPRRETRRVSQRSKSGTGRTNCLRLGLLAGASIFARRNAQIVVSAQNCRAYPAGCQRLPLPPTLPPRLALSIARHQAPVPTGRLFGSCSKPRR